MSLRFGSSLLVGSTVVASYIPVVVGSIMFKLFELTYRVRSSAELSILMPTITQLASRFAWVFALTVVLIGAVTLALLRRSPARYRQFLAVGLSSQALVVWLAMFCFCFRMFLGPMSMHHDSSFELAPFFQFAFGIFPMTLFAILWPAFVALFASKDRCLVGRAGKLEPEAL